ncbi:hypothetical protein KP004_01340 [Geomonas oryzisoli]|uniref:Uncharacterized protein n=1 Tax=Geomonas oryzisoli TaxID=2847992 RepID=A0ABX8JAW9_9BACT|nr:hypothetical protein [Geomonas oryzisoli]QWV93867.1 hypothetical protein KP004_01340 [Geomonas oryzisoli]
MNTKIIDMTASMIKNKLGTVTDLPVELANTIANVYYKYCKILVEEANRNQHRGDYIPNSITRERGSIANNMFEWMEKVERLSVICNSTIPETVNILRQIRDNEPPGSPMYSMLVEVEINTYKYNIKDAISKSPLRAKIERKFSKVDEIPNLIDFIEV